MPPTNLVEEVSARMSELFGTGPALDVQAKVLARTREKLAALEARLADLEQRLKQAD
jgi:hypothetical protein